LTARVLRHISVRPAKLGSRSRATPRKPTGKPDTWTLQDAKARLSEVLRRSRTDGPQHVTMHGREEAVILSVETFRADKPVRCWSKHCRLARTRLRHATGIPTHPCPRRGPVNGCLLDRNILSEAIRPRPEPKVLRFLAGQPLERLYASVVTFAEIRYGIECASDPARRLELQDWLTHRLRPMFTGRVLPIVEDVMLTWRHLLQEGQRACHPFP
jgi:prevent-host-death family protein